jgi:hypothetical protein
MPRADQAPHVFESRADSDRPPVLAKDRCRVGFWNMSGRDVTLVVDGQARLLPRNRLLTLDLARTFAWQIDQQPRHTERVAEDRATYEVVIR